MIDIVDVNSCVLIWVIGSVDMVVCCGVVEWFCILISILIVSIVVVVDEVI